MLVAECCVGSIDITHLLSSLVEKQYKFYPTMIYLISTVVNSYSEFRMAIKDEELIVWDGVNPASPRSHSYLCSRGFTPLPSRCILKSIGYILCHLLNGLSEGKE
ncbi:hypothetical protein C6H68_09110 [Photorhabdus luminescens]|nr:hypothetical protein C6H68_09110 [Photorhabdus luminescens]